MRQQLRKSIVIPFQTHDKEFEVKVNVNWDILEKVERAYGTSAEYVATMILTNGMHVQRHKVSQVLQLWCHSEDIKQVDIAEAVQTCSYKQFDRYVGMLQAAILWSIRGPEGLPLITDAQFDQLVAGEDINSEESPIQKAKSSEATKPKKPRAATSKKRTA